MISASHPDQTYVGFTTEIRKRLLKHNEGGCPHTSKYRPWVMAWFCGFPDKFKALDFEKYLKSHSGKAFASKHLI
jgi:predicted GIY-YIG superfamily endonuclease